MLKNCVTLYVLETNRLLRKQPAACAFLLIFRGHSVKLLELMGGKHQASHSKPPAHPATAKLPT